MRRPAAWKTWAAPAFLFCWPFLFLLPFVVPLHGHYFAIGNDFEMLYYCYKPYLLDGLTHFHIPLWSPAEAAGYPFAANPFTQSFYPLNALLVICYRFLGGYTSLDHQRFAVLGISIFCVGLYYWLRLLKLSWRPALFSAAVMAISFKMTELLRFPNAIHAAAWYPWILVALTQIAFQESIAAVIGWSGAMAGFMIALLTAGYPYYALYAPFLFLPYIYLLLAAVQKQELFANPPYRWKIRLLAALTGAATAFLICAPYLSKVLELMNQTVHRGGGNLEYSTSTAFSGVDAIGSWVFPPASQMEGWYYFGAVGFWLLVLYAMTRQSKHPVTPGPFAWAFDSLPFKLFLACWIIVIGSVAGGKSSLLFRLLWNYIPMVSRARMWGRLNIVLVPILALPLAIAYDQFENRYSSASDEHSAKQNVKLFFMVCLVLAIVLRLQIFFLRSGAHQAYWNTYFIGPLAGELGFKEKNLSAFLGSMIIDFTIAAFCGIVLLLRQQANAFFKTSSAKTLVVAGMLIFSAWNLWLPGPMAWFGGLRPVEARSRLDVETLDRQSFSVPRTGNIGTLSLTSSFGVGHVPDWYFQRFIDFHHAGNQEPLDQMRLLGMVNGVKLLFSRRIDSPTIHAFFADSDRLPCAMHIQDYTGDVLQAVIQAPADGYVSFIDNWDPHWKARVDGRDTPIQLLFGTFKSVPVSAGTHDIEFMYDPWGKS